MNTISLDEIKKKELNILLYFDEYCKKHDLHYYLVGGTLLGAIRHKGFIPWDDDIDVGMPRPDYDIFVNEWNNEKEKYKVKSMHNGMVQMPFAKLVDLSVRVEFTYTDNNIDTNLWIDIFPIDGLPNDYKQVKKIYKKTKIYRKILLLADARLGEGTNVIKKYSKYILRPFAKLYGRERAVNNIERLALKCPYGSSKYVGIITWGLYGTNERIKKEDLEKIVDVEFETYFFPAFSCWDYYLRNLYGDYLKLPPEEKRKGHEMIAFLVDNKID